MRASISTKGRGYSLNRFLRADAALFGDWVVRRETGLLWVCVGAIVAGAGVYGLVMGSWRDAAQAIYTGIKLPLVLLLTTMGNGMLNGMLAPLLGLNVTFKQSLVLVLFSFSIASLILGALAPVALLIVWNTPPLTTGTRLSSVEYGFLQLVLAAFVAAAGIAGNAKLLPLLQQWTTSYVAGRRVLNRLAGRQSLFGKPNCVGPAALHLGSRRAVGVHRAPVLSRQLL